MIWVVVAIVAVIVIWAVLDFNGLVTLRNRVENGWSEIDVQLRRRYDLIPNLVETVKGYAEHERGVFEDVTNARSAAMGTQGLEKASAENQITAGIGRLFAVAENYPDLKANQNFLALQEEITGTESKIAYARQFYNDEVMKLNTKIQRFPSSIIAGLFHFEPRQFFQIDDPSARGPVQVSF